MSKHALVPAAPSLASPPPGEETILLPAIELRRLRLTIIGLTPYVSRAFSDRDQARMAATQAHAPRSGPARRVRDPEQEFRDAIHVTKDGRPGLPADAFYAAAMQAAPFVQIPRPHLRAGFRLESFGVLPILGPPPTRREDVRRLPGGQADLVYRAQYWPWQVRVRLRYVASIFTAAQIVNLMRWAGFSVGIGEGRPGSPNSFVNLDLGTFDVGADIEEGSL